MGWVKYFGSRNLSSGQRRNAMSIRTGPQLWGRRTSVLPGGVGVTTNMFNAVEEFLQDFGQSINNFRYGEQALRT